VGEDEEVLVRPEEVGMGVGEGRPVGGLVLVGREGQSMGGGTCQR
jgi:hypothetical protein